MSAGWIQWCITYTRCYFERCRGYVEQRIKHFRHIITSDLSDKCDIEYEKRVFVFHVNRVTANCQWCQCKGQLLQWWKTGGPDPLPPGFNPPPPPPPIFSLFFRVPPHKIQIFCPRGPIWPPSPCPPPHYRYTGMAVRPGTLSVNERRQWLSSGTKQCEVRWVSHTQRTRHCFLA